MICSTPVHQVCNYAASSQYCTPPGLEQIEQGVIPLDSLPADWWNFLWNDANKAINEARSGFTALINELESVLNGAGIEPDCTCINQVYRAIDKIRQTLATASVAGAVKSSSANGDVTVNEDGTMTANGLGNVSNRCYGSSTTVVGMINDVYNYACDEFATMNGNVQALINDTAPKSHASSATTYGVGNASNYGHVKLSDTYTSCVGAAADSIAASQKSVYDAYTALNNSISGKAPTSHASTATTYGVGNASNYGHVKLSDTYSSCVGAAANSIGASQKALYDAYTALNNSSAKLTNDSPVTAYDQGDAYYGRVGTATTAARADHVHPFPFWTNMTYAVDVLRCVGSVDCHGGTCFILCTCSHSPIRAYLGNWYYNGCCTGLMWLTPGRCICVCCCIWCCSSCRNSYCFIPLSYKESGK